MSSSSPKDARLSLVTEGAPVGGSDDSLTRTTVQPRRQWTAEDEAAKDAWGPALREAFDLDPRKLAGIAAIVDIAPQTLARLCDPHEHSAPNLMDIARVARARPKVFAKLLKGLGDALGQMRESRLSIDAALRHVMSEIGDAVRAYDEAMRDDKFSADDRARVLAEIQEAKHALAELEATVTKT